MVWFVYLFVFIFPVEDTLLSRLNIDVLLESYWEKKKIGWKLG